MPYPKSNSVLIKAMDVYTWEKKSLRMTRFFPTERQEYLSLVRERTTRYFPRWVGKNYGILAMAGYVIPGEMFAWTAVLILPINSALNPFMYTFSAIISAKKFSPNIQEQTSTDDSEENGKLILEVLPYVVQKNGSYSNRMCSPTNVLRMKTLSAEACVYIIHVLNSYLALLHDNGLFLDNNLDDRYIMLKISSNLQIMKKVKITGIPTLSSKRSRKGNQARDIYQIGRLASRLLRAADDK